MLGKVDDIPRSSCTQFYDAIDILSACIYILLPNQWLDSQFKLDICLPLLVLTCTCHAIS